MTRKKAATWILAILIAAAIALFYAPMLFGIAHLGDPVTRESKD